MHASHGPSRVWCQWPSERAWHPLKSRNFLGTWPGIDTRHAPKADSNPVHHRDALTLSSVSPHFLLPSDDAAGHT
jgi:hypothetical protein